MPATTGLRGAGRVPGAGRIRASAWLLLVLAPLLPHSGTGAAPRFAAVPGEAVGRPYRDGRFQGRIAWSADGNHNDPDDWIASPTALAIFAESGLRDRLVHFDYNSILPQTEPEWERIHAAGVLGAADRYGYDRATFHDCRRDPEAAVASIARAVNRSSARDPLYFVIAGPMEVPYLGLRRADPAKRRFVYCISHSRWNDGFASGYTFRHTKRDLIEQGVNWVQIRDQNPLLSLSRYGRPAEPEQFSGYFWMRDAPDPRLRFLWERMLISTRPDPSDAGMAWFLATGDEECDPARLGRLLLERRPQPPAPRRRVRLEAENFRRLEGFALEDRGDRAASHRLQVKLEAREGSIRTRFDEPHAPESGRCRIEVRYLDPGGPADERIRLEVRVNGAARSTGAAEATGAWRSHLSPETPLRRGDEIAVTARGAGARLDYVQLDFAPEP